MPNAARLGGDRATYPPAADEPELLAAELHPEHEVERPPSPFAATNQPIAFGDAARERKDQRPGELGGRLREHVRRIREHHTSRLDRRHIDVVVTNRNVGHDLQIGKTGIDDALRRSVRQKANQRLLSLRVAAFNSSGASGDGAIVQIDIARGFEPRERCGGDATGQEDGRL